MSNQSAQMFMERLMNDEALAEKFAALSDNPEGMRAALAEEGVDAEPLEIFDAMVDKFDMELTEEQLAAVAGGLGAVEIASIAIVSVTTTATVIVVVTAAASAAAI